jgi:nucleolar GTP-binding protein
MSFQTISKVETPQQYLDTAFRQGRDKLPIAKQKARGPKIERLKTAELERLKAVKKSLLKSLERILTTFPSMDQLSDFYRELVKATLDWRQLKKSLGAVNWAKGQIEKLHKSYSTKVKHTYQLRIINTHRREFYGRVSSVLKQIKKELAYLELARRTLRSFPSIKQNMTTVALFGFPNVGKTTILTKLTPADPEIAAYPFTTRSINIGYSKKGTRKLQLIDTPGTLNRFEKMNSIEKQAYLAVKHIAHAVVYVFDLTEPYPLEQQKKLYNRIKKSKKPVIIYLSKTDIIDKQTIQKFLDKYDAITEIKQLKDYLFALD